MSPKRSTVYRLLGLALVTALTGCESTETSTPAATKSPDVTPTLTVDNASTPVPIEPGTYRVPRSPWSVVDFTVTFPEGWGAQYGHVYLKNSDEPDELSFYPVLVDAIYADACKGSGKLMEVGPQVDDILAALVRQRGPMESGPVETAVGGYPASRVDLNVPYNIDLETCRLGEIGLQVWYSPPADKYFVLLADGTASVYIVDVAGQRQVFLTQYRSGASAEDVRELEEIIDSIRIDP